MAAHSNLALSRPPTPSMRGFIHDSIAHPKYDADMDLTHNPTGWPASAWDNGTSWGQLEMSGAEEDALQRSPDVGLLSDQPEISLDVPSHYKQHQPMALQNSQSNVWHGPIPPSIHPENSYHSMPTGWFDTFQQGYDNMMNVPCSTSTRSGHDVGAYAIGLQPSAVPNHSNNQVHTKADQTLPALTPSLSRQLQPASYQPGRTVHAIHRTNKVRTTAKKTMKTQPKEMVVSVKDWKVFKAKQRRVYTQEEKEIRKKVRECHACLRCQYLRRTCATDDGKPCGECTKEGAKRLLWLECVRPKFNTISIDVTPDFRRSMRRKKSYFSDFMHEYLLPAMPHSNVLDFKTSTTYLKQWLAGQPISTDFTLASLLHTDFEKLLPAFGANLGLLIGFIATDTMNIDLRIEALGKSSGEIDQLREYVSNEVLYIVEHQLQEAHKKITDDARRPKKGRYEVTDSLFLLLLICGVAIGCAVGATCSGPSKDKIARQGDSLCGNLCRYLILAGRQLNLIASSTDEAALYNRWRQARIIKVAVEHTPPKQHSLQDAWRQASPKEGMQEALVASPSFLTPSYGIAGDMVDSSVSSEATTPSLVHSSAVTPRPCTPYEVGTSKQLDEFWTGDPQGLEQFTFDQYDDTLTMDFPLFEQDSTKYANL